LPLGEVVQTQKGKKPVELGMRDGFHTVPYINISVFEGNPVKEYAPTQDIPQCRASDTLLVWDGARAGLCGRGVVGYIGSTLMRITSDCVNPAYLYYFLHSQYGTLNTRTKGVGIPHIDPVVFNNLEFSLAPTAEQTRIVAKLEELLSDLDAGVAELKAAQKKLAQYRQSLLKAAVEGALTAHWREERRQHNGPTETGAQLLQRILTERRARWEARQLARFKEQSKTPPKDWQKKYSEPVPPDTNGLPGLPEGWAWASLGQLLDVITSGSRDWAPYYDRGTSIFVMAQNVRPWRPDFSFRQFVDPPDGNRDRARSKVEKDDLLITIVGANTGQCCRVHEHLENHFVCQSVALLRPTDTPLSGYINAVLNSEGHGQRQFREMNYGAGRPHLSFDQIESVLVPLPPFSEQQEIIKAIELALVSLADTDSQLRITDTYMRAQRQNILKSAFSGQLVPQDPHDEPASVLLARIRAERAAQPALKKSRGRQSKDAA
jgi:type I restriction enzyme, S subunit